MGHGFFVPVIAAVIAWMKRGEIAGKAPRPNWWGLAIMLWAGLQLYVATLGAEFFLARTSFVISLIGAVLLLGGTEYLRVFGFPSVPAVLHDSDPGDSFTTRSRSACSFSPARWLKMPSLCCRFP